MSGTVVDWLTREPIVGATVIDAATRKGTVSDIDGRFAISTAALPATLRISFIGYKPQEAVVTDAGRELAVSLEEEVNDLAEMVAVGYGTQRRTQLTGSVTKIKADVFASSPSPTLDGALGGAVAGLNVTAASGQPGAASSIRIRGGNSVNASNEPLYVIDGFIYYKDAGAAKTGLGAIESSLNPLSTVNPMDIESVEVLKDISATAIYGSRGANGVILVTTRRGSRDRTVVSYRYTVGLDAAARRLDLMNAREWADYQKTYFYNKGGYTDEQIAALGDGTDWQDAMLQTALRQSHELSVTGGSAKGRYAFSASSAQQDGVIINLGFDRYNATATVRADKSSRFAGSHRWGCFPSLGLSWNADREGFLAGSPTVSQLKARASFGVVGNQEIGDYEYSLSYTAGHLLRPALRGNSADQRRHLGTAHSGRLATQARRRALCRHRRQRPSDTRQHPARLHLRTVDAAALPPLGRPDSLRRQPRQQGVQLAGAQAGADRRQLQRAPNSARQLDARQPRQPSAAGLQRPPDVVYRQPICRRRIVSEAAQPDRGFHAARPQPHPGTAPALCHGIQPADRQLLFGLRPRGGFGHRHGCLFVGTLGALRPRPDFLKILPENNPNHPIINTSDNLKKNYLL